VFHELAHQVAYSPGDSQFNESFATAVEAAGLERWLAVFGNDALRKSHDAHSARKKAFLRLLMKTRRELEDNYSRSVSDSEKKRQKVVIFKHLQTEYQVLKTSWNGYAGYDRWFGEPLSNAHLASIATYQDFVPAFHALYLREKTLPRFYEAVKALAQMDKPARHRQLNALALQAPVLSAQTGELYSMSAPEK
jgi:predicted aminopeptidase